MKKNKAELVVENDGSATWRLGVGTRGCISDEVTLMHEVPKWATQLPGRKMFQVQGTANMFQVKGKACSINMQSIKAVSRRDRSRENKVESA